MTFTVKPAKLEACSGLVALAAVVSDPIGADEQTRPQSVSSIEKLVGDTQSRDLDDAFAAG